MWRRPGALALAVGLPTVEAIALVASGQHGALGLAPQASALAPFAVLQQMRWMIVYTWSAWSVAAALVGIVVLQSTIQTALVVAVWPDGRRRPSVARLFGRNAVVTVACLVLLWPAATLLFGAGATGLAIVLYLGLALVLLLAPLLVHGVADGLWWRRLPSGRAVALAYLSFVVLSLTAAPMELAPLWLAPVVAGLTGLFNAWAWSGIVESDGRRPAPFDVVPANALAALVACGLVVTLVWVGFRGWGGAPQQYRPPDPASAHGRRPVLLVAGYGSSYDGTLAVRFGRPFFTWQYSYAGLGPGGVPRAYARATTYQSLDASIDALGAQVRRLHSLTGREVTIVATSEGSVVARAYVGVTPHAPVGYLLMLSPLIRPDQVFWPDGRGEGRGDGGRFSIAALGLLGSHITPFEVRPDLPFFRSMLTHADALRAGMTCPAPRVRIDAIVPAAGTAATPTRRDSHIPIRIVSGFHGSAVAPQEVPHLVRTFVHDERVPHDSAWGVFDAALRATASAWRVPELPLQLNGPWRSARGGGRSDCASSAAGFARWERARTPDGR